MEKKNALDALAALAQSTRLDVFRLLMQAGPEGLSAGDLADRVAVRPNTLSANLAVLLNAGLVRNRRDGRSIRYFAQADTMRGLLGFLLQDCCGGNPAQCAPLLDQLATRRADPQKAPAP